MNKVYNKRRTISYILVLLLVFLSFEVKAQKRHLEKADAAFTNKSYIDAASIYEKVLDKGYRSESLLQNLGDSYYFNGKYEEASKWYSELFQMNAAQSSEYVLRYAQSLKAVGNDSLGDEYYTQYLSVVSGVKSQGLTAKQHSKLLKANSGRYTLKKVPFNSDGIDFGIGYWGSDKLVFASTRKGSVLRNRVSSWDGLSYLDLYEVSVEQDTVYGTPRSLKGDVNGKYHESTVCFTHDGETMYFTRTNFKKNKSSEDLLHLKIFKASLENGKWVKEEELSINGDEYNTAHPTLNVSEDRLYFASDRPGGQGGTDLYYVELKEDGSLGEVVNLGEKINTPGRESFPYISEEGELYFSSDGHFGLGGYDVFYVNMDASGGFTGNVLNVGSPINSSYDDVCYVVRSGKGYISSNRSESTEEVYDDIYRFVEHRPIKDLTSQLYGVVTDKSTGAPLPEATVEVYDTDNTLLYSLKTDAQGYYSQEVSYEPAYILKVTKSGYSSADAFSNQYQEDREHNFELEAKETELTVGTDLAKVLDIPIIYFDFDKSNIRPDAAVELQKIVEVMNQYPDMKIDIRSHTDSRGSDSYNAALSDRRAKSTMEYIISQGISKDRLTSKGYGERQLVNHCSNGVPCSKEEHQANRRSEFIVVEK